ncbi:MAG: PBS lyase [Burkholderiales bacterium PBB5]|nr:MAG: PBS lyase [Burkholderiales bacterium PBB5]
MRKTSALEPLHQVVEREHPRDLPGLLTQLRSGDADQRRWAARDLARQADAAVALGEAVVAARDPTVRDAIFTSLGDLRHEQVVPWLLQVLQQDDAVNVVAAAYEVLAEVGAPGHIPALRAAQTRFADDPFIGFAADMAIERIEAA